MKNIAGIIAFVPVIGIVIYHFICENGIIDHIQMRNFWYCCVCAGLSGAYFWGYDKKCRIGITMLPCAFYMLYLLLIYLIFRYVKPDYLNYEWIFVASGGVIVCIILGLLFRQNSP